MKRYPKSVLAGYVHMDEPNARPHVHVLMVPVVEERKKIKKLKKKSLPDDGKYLLKSYLLNQI